MVTVQITARKLAQIALASAGYSVDIMNDNVSARYPNASYPATDIRFSKRTSGRINRSLVEMQLNGRTACFDADTILNVLD